MEVVGRWAECNTAYFQAFRIKAAYAWSEKLVFLVMEVCHPVKRPLSYIETFILLSI